MGAPRGDESPAFEQVHLRNPWGSFEWGGRCGTGAFEGKTQDTGHDDVDWSSMFVESSELAVLPKSLKFISAIIGMFLIMLLITITID